MGLGFTRKIISGFHFVFYQVYETQKQQKSSTQNAPPMTESTAGGTTQPAPEQMVEASTSQETQAVAGGDQAETKSLNERVERFVCSNFITY